MRGAPAARRPRSWIPPGSWQRTAIRSRNSPAAFGHFGGAGTFLWVDPDVGLGLVVLTDREFGPWALEAWPRLSDDVLSAAAS